MRAKRSRTSSDATSSSPQPSKKLVKASSTTEDESKSTRTRPASTSSSLNTGASSGSSKNAQSEVVKSQSFKDMEKYRKACRTIKSLFEQMKVLKDQGVEKTDPGLNSLHMQCLLSFVSLKKCNRSTQIRNKQAREKTQEAKQEVDSLHLQLQNLLYEITHLKKEINKCLQFKSKDQEIDLVSEEEFCKENGKNMDELLTESSHDRMLSRLGWELQERKSLTGKKQNYVAERKMISQEIQTKKEFLNSLEPQLKTILKATSPIQEFLGLRLESKRLQYQTAKYLPRPLYVLFVQSMAYQEACDPHMIVEIIGDVEAAKAVIEDKPGVVDVDFDEKIEKNEEDEPEAEEQPKKRHHRRTTEELCGEEKIKTALKEHPLQVQLELICKAEEKSVLLFSYIQSLNIVTVTVSISSTQPDNSPVFSGRSLLSPDSVLTCLFPQDFGDVTPNPANHFQLSNLGVSDVAFPKLNIGHPYIWVQRICGLDFPSLDVKTDKAQEVEPSVSASHMERTIQAIKARVLTRISLQSQFHSLESLNIQLSDEGRRLFPVKTLSKLESWTPQTISDFSELPFVDHITQLESISENDLLFLATFLKDKVKLKAAVIVPCDYPVRPPLFTLAVSNNGSYIKNDYIRALETEVNVFYEELFAGDCKDNILSNQLRRLQMCFDVYNDTNAAGAEELTNHEFLILRTKRGRDRAMALQFDQNHRCFTHRCKEINSSS
ncbi:THO complex subunit 5 homolog [Dendronephthya gigantea]|uniref:THO complex subunit 5 homolog n=1 Tax=Dendronephthya gigantea TaxID=151771 RepID=UPI00106C184E|nr:THO complex subunit 5 homolog [Dendronephthya gigantea]